MNSWYSFIYDFVIMNSVAWIHNWIHVYEFWYDFTIFSWSSIHIWIIWWIYVRFHDCVWPPCGISSISGWVRYAGAAGKGRTAWGISSQARPRHVRAWVLTCPAAQSRLSSCPGRPAGPGKRRSEVLSSHQYSRRRAWQWWLLASVNFKLKWLSHSDRDTGSLSFQVQVTVLSRWLSDRTTTGTGTMIIIMPVYTM